MLRLAVAVVAVLGSGVTAGVLFAVALSVVPALQLMPAQQYVEAHRLLGRNWDPTMPLIVTTSLVADLLLALLADGPATRALAVAGAVALGGVAGVSHLLNVPLNRLVKQLPPGAPLPSDWQDPRVAWRTRHLVRTALAVLAFAATAVAAIA